MALDFKGDGIYFETSIEATPHATIITIKPTAKLKNLLEALEKYFELIRNVK